MPGFDGTGPLGAGAMTGGQRGVCNPPNDAYPARPMGSYGNSGMTGYGRGVGNFGRGFRRGFRNQPTAFYPADVMGNPQDRVSESKALQEQLNALKSTLDSIAGRISELENRD